MQQNISDNEGLSKQLNAEVEDMFSVLPINL